MDSSQDEQTEELGSEFSNKTSQSKPVSKQTKRFTEKVIEHGEKMETEFLPQTK